MPKTKGSRVTPKKDKTELEQRFADAGLPAEELTATEDDKFGGEVQIPAREAQIKVQAINDDHLLFTFVADNGMSVNNYTLSYDQIFAILEGMEPWLTNHVQRMKEETPDLAVVRRDTTLVGPDGRPLA